jgi:hypothetical protein
MKTITLKLGKDITKQYFYVYPEYHLCSSKNLIRNIGVLVSNYPAYEIYYFDYIIVKYLFYRAKP